MRYQDVCKIAKYAYKNAIKNKGLKKYIIDK